MMYCLYAVISILGYDNGYFERAIVKYPIRVHPM